MSEDMLAEMDKARALRASHDRLLAALKDVLHFHGATEWGADGAKKDAMIRVLCDHVRAVVARAEGLS